MPADTFLGTWCDKWSDHLWSLGGVANHDQQCHYLSCPASSWSQKVGRRELRSPLVQAEPFPSEHTDVVFVVMNFHRPHVRPCRREIKTVLSADSPVFTWTDIKQTEDNEQFTVSPPANLLHSTASFVYTHRHTWPFYLGCSMQMSGPKISVWLVPK